MINPKITVLMPVFNGEMYLSEAIESILSQTFKDFEFLIINDGSTDSTAQIIEKYKKIDPRIKVIEHIKNQGIVASLNEGLREAKGIYIARMDSDDVALPKRLEVQLDYLQQYSQFSAVGSWIQIIDESGNNVTVMRYETDPEILKYTSLIFTPIPHPSVMLLKEAVCSIGSYNPDAVHAEDFEMWSRFRVNYLMSIIPTVLLKYRIQEKSVSHKYSSQQLQKVLSISLKNISKYMISDEKTVELLRTPIPASIRNISKGFEQMTAQQKLWTNYCMVERVAWKTRIKLLWAMRLNNFVYQWTNLLFKH